MGRRLAHLAVDVGIAFQFGRTREIGIGKVGGPRFLVVVGGGDPLGWTVDVLYAHLVHVAPEFSAVAIGRPDVDSVGACIVGHWAGVGVIEDLDSVGVEAAITVAVGEHHVHPSLIGHVVGRRHAVIARGAADNGLDFVAVVVAADHPAIVVLAVMGDHGLPVLAPTVAFRPPVHRQVIGRLEMGRVWCLEFGVVEVLGPADGSDRIRHRARRRAGVAGGGGVFRGTIQVPNAEVGSGPRGTVGNVGGRSGVWIAPAHNELVARGEGGHLDPNGGLARRVPVVDLVLALGADARLEAQVGCSRLELAVAKTEPVERGVALAQAQQHVPVGQGCAAAVGWCDVHRVGEGSVVAHREDEVLDDAADGIGRGDLHLDDASFGRRAREDACAGVQADPRRGVESQETGGRVGGRDLVGEHHACGGFRRERTGYGDGGGPALVAVTVAVDGGHVAVREALTIESNVVHPALEVPGVGIGVLWIDTNVEGGRGVDPDDVRDRLDLVRDAVDVGLGEAAVALVSDGDVIPLAPSHAA